MTESDDLNRALQSLVDDLMADRPVALKEFEAWRIDHGDDIRSRNWPSELEGD